MSFTVLCYANFMNLRKGFTIVELLVVIVVIAILAGISITAYSGIQQRADTTSRLSEMKAWEKALRIYIADKGSLPIDGTNVVSGAPGGTYCLGTGFKNYGGDNRDDCGEVYAASDTATNPNNGYYTRIHPNTTLNAALGAYLTIPPGPRSLPNGEGLLGPIVTFFSSTTAVLYDVFPMTTCPANTNLEYAYSNRYVMCSITISTTS